MRVFLRLRLSREPRQSRRDASVLRPAPRLLVKWPSPLAELAGNLEAALAPSRVTPAMLEGFAVPLRRGSMRPRSLASSLLFHLAALVVLTALVPLLGRRPASAEELAALRKQKISWYLYDHELPAISPPAISQKEPGGGEKPSERGGQRPEPSPLGATAGPSQQVIISNPPQPDNARQTIVHPEAPNIRIAQEVRLPNVVMWASQPQKPTLEYLPAPQLRFRQTPRLVLPPDIAPPIPPVDLFRRSLAEMKLPKLGVTTIKPPAPEAPNLERRISELKIAASETPEEKPRLAVPPATTAPVTQAPDTQADAADADAASGRAEPPSPPQVATGAATEALERLIALGIDPATPSGEISVPVGNRAGSFSIAPSGKAPGTPAGGLGTGPAGQLAEIRVPSISVSGGIRPPSAGLGPVVSGPPPPPPTPSSTPVPARRANPNTIAALVARATRPATSLPEWRSRDRLAAQGFLYGKRVYTVYVNMPNLSSQSGSWIIRFSELSNRVPKGNEPKLIAPVALRKVDPGYDRGAIRDGVEGTVELYAVIHEDGKVDSVRVVRSLDPRLDQSAVRALLRWKFQPATRNGHPVGLEALVQIPFTLSRKPL